MRQGILNAAPFPEINEDALEEIANVSRVLESSIPELEREEALANLDYLVAKCFNLNFDDVKVIMTTFHKTWNPTAHLSIISNLFSKGSQ